jgi:hypothetical protein
MQNQDIIFVDMPGLDSSIDSHNRQIINYTQKEGISFIAIVDIDDGGVKDATLRFIEEIDSYRLNFFTIINKIDKKPSYEVESIKEHIKEQLFRYSKNPSVGVVSTFDNNIEEFKEIVSKIDKDSYIQSLFVPKVISNIDKIVQDLSIRREAIVLDTYEIDNKIEEINSAIYQFDKSLIREKQLIENKFSTKTVGQILDEVEKILKQNIDDLIVALETSQDNLKRTINDIIRPIIINSIDKYTQQEFNITIDRLEVNSKNIFTEISTFTNSTQVAIDIISTTIKTTPILLKIPTLIYILEIITTKINPILLIISTVVSVVSLFLGKSKATQKEERRENIREKILDSIPNILIELQPTVLSTLEEIKEDFFKEIESSIDNQKDELIASLDRVKKERDIYKNNIQEQIKTFDILIEKIKKSKERVTL